MTDANPSIQKVDGRTKAGRAVKASQQTQQSAAEAAEAIRQRPGTRVAARQTPVRGDAREGVRTRLPRGEVIGRNGEVLSRKRTSTADIFHIPPELIPDGWEYQWCAVSVAGNSEILMDQNLMFSENGWRPVPAERYPGRFMPANYKGNIIRGQQMLMERPKVLCDEARSEDHRNARQLISDRNEALMLTKTKQNLPDGFEMGRKYRGTGGDMRMSIDPALDIPAPSHTLAGPEE